MGPWDRFVIMLVPIVFMLCVTGVVILRPLSKRLGELLELMYEDRALGPDPVLAEISARLGSMEDRLVALEREQLVPPSDSGSGKSESLDSADSSLIAGES